MAFFDKMSAGNFRSKGSIIADQLLRKIKTGEHPVGSRLPAERLLAEQAGVSRTSVREAISALQIAGIIESRIGDGNYVVGDTTGEDLFLQAQSILEQSDSPYEIIQARKVIETGVVRLAIKEATDEDLDVIKAVWQKRYEIGRAGDYRIYTKLGKDLHLAIAQASGNRIIIAVLDQLLNISGQPLWQNMRRLYYEQDPARIQQMSDIHDRLVNAIVQRDTVEAILALEADFDSVTEQLYSFSG